jgi:hypothetical protein
MDCRLTKTGSIIHVKINHIDYLISKMKEAFESICEG